MRTIKLANGILAKQYDGAPESKVEMRHWIRGATLEELREPAKVGRLGVSYATGDGTRLEIKVGQWVAHLGHAVFMPITNEQAAALGLPTEAREGEGKP